MTTETTAKASVNSEPKKGEVLLYIDWEGKKHFAMPDAHKKDKQKDEQP